MLTIKIKGIEQEELLKKIYEAIKQFDYYHLVADADGDITYQKREWSEESKKAWMRPHFGDDGKMYFYIIGQKHNKMIKGIYAFYHSELSRFLLTQFDTYIEEIAISGSLMEGDLVGTIKFYYGNEFVYFYRYCYRYFIYHPRWLYNQQMG